jgi:hypothetical protein
VRRVQQYYEPLQRPNGKQCKPIMVAPRCKLGSRDIDLNEHKNLWTRMSLLVWSSTVSISAIDIKRYQSYIWGPTLYHEQSVSIFYLYTIKKSSITQTLPVQTHSRTMPCPWYFGTCVWGHQHPTGRKQQPQNEEWRYRTALFAGGHHTMQRMPSLVNYHRLQVKKTKTRREKRCPLWHTTTDLPAPIPHCSWWIKKCADHILTTSEIYPFPYRQNSSLNKQNSWKS